MDGKDGTIYTLSVAIRSRREREPEPNPKLEIRNPKQTQNLKSKCFKPPEQASADTLPRPLVSFRAFGI
jgi:hypothetical protein